MATEFWAADCDSAQVVRPGKPDYLLHYPCFKKVQLTAVKDQIYNADLPTLRAMDRDTVMQKLSDDHCQTTSCKTHADFVEASRNPPIKPISALNPRIQPIIERQCFDVAETGKPPLHFQVKVEDILRARSIWSRYLASPGLFDDHPEHLLFHKDNFGRRDDHFDGVQVQRMKPVVTNIRKSFRSEPRLDPLCRLQQQQPIPFETTGRHRHTYPIFFRDMSIHPWRDPKPKAEHETTPVGIRTRKR